MANLSPRSDSSRSDFIVSAASVLAGETTRSLYRNSSSTGAASTRGTGPGNRVLRSMPSALYTLAAISAGVTGRSRGSAPCLSDEPITWPPAHAGAGEQHRPHAGPVIAAATRVQARRPAKFTHRQHQRAGQQAALLQIIEQRRVGQVEHRTERVLVIVERCRERTAGGVTIPCHLVEDRIEHVHRDQAHALLDQPAGLQTALAESAARHPGRIGIEDDRLVLRAQVTRPLAMADAHSRAAHAGPAALQTAARRRPWGRANATRQLRNGDVPDRRGRAGRFASAGGPFRGSGRRCDGRSG